MTPTPIAGAPDPAPAGKPPTRRLWILPLVFAACCALTLWCAVALLADRPASPPPAAPSVAPSAALRVG